MTPEFEVVCLFYLSGTVKFAIPPTRAVFAKFSGRATVRQQCVSKG